LRKTKESVQNCFVLASGLLGEQGKATSNSSNLGPAMRIETLFRVSIQGIEGQVDNGSIGTNQGIIERFSFQLGQHPGFL
jgi:hypothetical protein